MNRYVLTCNNWTQSDLESLLRIPAVFLIVGFEKTQSGIPHIQAYIETEKGWPYLRRSLARYYFAPAKGTREQNIKYCSKGGQHLIFPGS